MAAAAQKHAAPDGPIVVVIVPRAVAYRWSCEPWADVVRAAELNTDGLRLATEAERSAFRAADDTAQLREGVGHRASGKTMLYKQGW
jgi:hypothetical protein